MIARHEQAGEAVVIGVDGGRTTTKVVLVTLQGQTLAHGQGGPVPHLAAEHGTTHFVAALREAFDDAWQRAGSGTRPVAAIGLGLSGIEAGTPEARTAQELLATLVTTDRIAIESDGVAALVGAQADAPGIIAIAGTGSIVLGQDRAGRRARAGGWGWLLGDEGSAMAVGRGGLIAALRAFDGVDPPTLLQEAIVGHYGLAKPHDITRIVYGVGFGSRDFGALAALVATAAGQGDSTAQAIINAEGAALARQVVALIARLDFGDETIPVAPVGGAFAHVAGLREAFTSALTAARPAPIVRDPLLPPVYGAALLAFRTFGPVPDTILEALHASAR